MLGSLGSSTAKADCPAPYDGGIDCTVGGVEICYSVGGGSGWECDLARGGGSGGGTLTAVLNTGSTCDTDYCIWGTQTGGTAFCCELDASAETDLNIRGTSNGDTITFYDSGTGESLDNYTSGSSPPFTGHVYAGNGADTITGSEIAAMRYRDELHGDSGNDVLYGGAGDDLLTGDSDDDELHGGTGQDALQGQTGHDLISGNAGVDTIYGGDDIDYISGGAGNDILHGDDGNDILCGDDGQEDTFTGDAGNDTLWGADSVDSDNGGAGTDVCDTTAIAISCTASITTRPTECPSDY